MFKYKSADITYAVSWGKLDGSSDIEYLFDLNKKESRIYTKARMLGQDLEEVMDTLRIEREIIRYERYEYDSDIRDASISITLCDNQKQPPVEDIKAYIKDLLATHRVTFAHEVVEAQINVFEDMENDWNQIALDLAMEVNCPGYAKKYQDGKFNKDVWDKEREELLLKLQQERERKEQEKREREEKLKAEENPWIDKSWQLHKIPEEEKINRYRGCKNITKSTDTKLHIITKNGKEVVLDAVWPFELSFYGVGLCPYNAKEWDRNKGYGGYSIGGCRAGTWGFIDTDGNVVVKPQYKYISGPYGFEEEEYYIVAKDVKVKNYWGEDNIVTLWGILDSKGNESIPCQHKRLLPALNGRRSYNIIIYIKEIYNCDRYGLMKTDGTEILKPQFNYISSENFNWDNKMFLAGSSHFNFGVFSLDKNKFITPDMCENVKFNDETKTIECTYHVDMGGWYSIRKGVYDYDGNEIKLK